MEHSRQANLDDVADAMEKSAWYLWQTLKYSSYDHNEIDAMINDHDQRSTSQPREGDLEQSRLDGSCSSTGYY